MNYIFLVAGRGTRLQPLTLKQSKSMYKLDKNTTVLQRMVSKIKKYDPQGNIIVVDGFMHENIETEIQNVTFIRNPFYAVTNSIASLWFARNYLKNDEATIINGDIVMEDKLIETVVCAKTQKPLVVLDSSIKSDGDYNVQVNNGRVLVMSKDLDSYFGEYAGVTKLDNDSAKKLCAVVEQMVDAEMYDQWYENALDWLIFNEDFELFYTDIADGKWTEVDCVDDMLLARQIHGQEK